MLTSTMIKYTGLTLLGNSGEIVTMGAHFTFRLHQKRSEVVPSLLDFTHDQDCTPSFSSILTRVISRLIIIQTEMAPGREKINCKNLRNLSNIWLQASILISFFFTPDNSCFITYIPL